MFDHAQNNRVLMIVENCSYLHDARVGKQAKALMQKGYQVSVISAGQGAFLRPILVEGVKVYRFPRIPFVHGTLGYFLEYAYATLAIAILTAYVFLVQGFDIVHIANPPDCIVLVTAIYKLIGKRIIFDQHDLCPELYVCKFARPSALLLKLQLLLERLAYKLADHTIVTNESCRSIALGRGRRSPANVTVVRNGPKMEYLKITDGDVELRERSPHIIAFAGITGYQDGLDHLCRALRSLRYDLGRDDFLCIVLGDGDALPHIKSMAHELGLDENMWFAGWVSDPEQYFRYIATADICAAPEASNGYNDRSTFVKMMEYMVVGKPIVAFDLPENRISAEGAALYVSHSEREFAVKLAELMDDAALRKAMGEVGRQRIEAKLAWQYSIPDLLKVYELVSQSDGVAQRLWNRMIEHKAAAKDKGVSCRVLETSARTRTANIRR